jgi:Protein of unknown function (DUF2914)
MSGSENTRWVAMSALGAAMFAIGFSFAGVACSNTRDVSVTEAARSADSASTVPAPASSLGNVAAVVNAAAVATAAPSAAAPATTSAATKLSASDGALKLKRVVVTHKIENREPTAGDDFTLGGAPVYAFVELENSGSAPRDIRVMFQNEDTKASVGHVKLTVPASQARYRTWGNTRLIRDPGHWIAVVSTTDGVELGRAPFEVKG